MHVREFSLDPAHKLVESACRSAQSEHRHLRSVLSEDPDVKSILSAQAIDRLFEPRNYLGSANAFIDAVLAAAGNRLERNLAKGKAKG